MSLSQIELVWIRVRVEWECFWVNVREDNKVSESNMAVSESNMAAFKMAAIIKLSQNEWVKFFLCKCWELIFVSVSEFERKNYYGWIQDGRIQIGRIQDGCHHQVESEWMSKFFSEKWMNPRWLPSSNWDRMNDFESDWISWNQSF